MTNQPITASDIAGWDSLKETTETLKTRSLKSKTILSDYNTLALQLADDEFITYDELAKKELLP